MTFLGYLLIYSEFWTGCPKNINNTTASPKEGEKMLTKWLKKIEKMAETLPRGYPKPITGKVKEGEVVLGTVPPSLRKLLGVVQQLRDEADAVHAAHVKKCHASDMKVDRSECEKNNRQVALLREQMEAVRRVFLCSLVYELETEELNIILRENWTVAKSPNKPKPELPEIVVVDMSVTGKSLTDILWAGRDRGGRRG